MKKVKFETVAFFLILFFGICLRIVTPPYQVADEIFHFPRAWQISEGQFVSPSESIRKAESADNPTLKTTIKAHIKDGKVFLHSEDEKLLLTEIPRSMIPENLPLNIIPNQQQTTFDKIKNFLSTPLNQQETEVVILQAMGQYSPLAYFPQATAAFVGRNLNLNAGVIYYAMCFASLFFSALCVLFSMKLLSEKKFLIFLLAMMPMFLAEITSTSADAMTYSICFLITAWLFSLRKKNSVVDYKEIFGLIVISIVLALLKSVYGAILLLYFSIPTGRFKNFSGYICLGTFLLFLNLVTSSIWNYVAINLSDVKMWSKFYLGFVDVDFVNQKNFILENPATFMKIFFDSLINFDSWFPISFVGVLGNYNLIFPGWFYKISIAVIFVASLFGNLKLNLFQRSVNIAIIFITFLGIFIVEYLMWTSVGSSMVEGVQGRYFIPIALLGFSTLSFLPTPKYLNLIALLIGIFSAVFTIHTTYSAFY